MIKYLDLILAGVGGCCLITAAGLLAGWVFALGGVGLTLIGISLVVPSWD